MWDEEVRMTEDDRQRIMAEKAAKYARQQRGEEVPDAESSVDVSHSIVVPWIAFDCVLILFRKLSVST